MELTSDQIEEARVRACDKGVEDARAHIAAMGIESAEQHVQAVNGSEKTGWLFAIWEHRKSMGLRPFEIIHTFNGGSPRCAKVKAYTEDHARELWDNMTESYNDYGYFDVISIREIHTELT